VASLFKAVADVLSVPLLDTAPVPRLHFNTGIASELLAPELLPSRGTGTSSCRRYFIQLLSKGARTRRRTPARPHVLSAVRPLVQPTEQLWRTGAAAGPC